MRRFLRIVAALLLVGVALVAVLAVNALRFTSRQVPIVPPEAFAPLPGATQRLAGAIAIPTVSHGDAARRDTVAFRAVHDYVARSFPLAHAAMRREFFRSDAVLYTWAGTDSAASPIVLMAHLDVVPVESATEGRWTHRPFAGVVDEQFVWGRGTQDDKAGALGILEAAEALLTRQFRPERTIYIAFGADEETGGAGAHAIAESLRVRGVRPALVLDEGGAVVRGVMPGIDAPLALVGVAEKGYASVRLEARGAGGHSSMPPRRTAVGTLARAIARLEDEPFPAGIRGPVASMLDHVGREMPFGLKIVFANRWLTDPVIKYRLASDPTTDASLRTTTAVTMLEGSPKENVLPSRARAVVNFRLMPGDSVGGVVDRVRRVVADSAVAVILDTTTAIEPSRVSPDTGPVWETLARTIRSIYPDAIVSPYLSVGGTDARWYTGLSPHVYRFLPQRWGPDDVARMHGIDERVRVSAYAEQIRFYAAVIQNFAGVGRTEQSDGVGGVGRAAAYVGQSPTHRGRSPSVPTMSDKVRLSANLRRGTLGPRRGPAASRPAHR
jgi:carboxypeptidase PM20D1